MKDYYEILEVSRKASKDTINKIFKIHMKACHPDLFQGEEKQKAEEKSKEYTQAYNVLSDDTERAKYDEQLKAEELQNNSKLQTVIEENEYLKQVIAKKDDLIKRLSNIVYDEPEYSEPSYSSVKKQYSNPYQNGFNNFDPPKKNPYEGMSLEELQKLKKEETKQYYKNIFKDIGIKLILLILLVVVLLISLFSSFKDLANML